MVLQLLRAGLRHGQQSADILQADVLERSVGRNTITIYITQNSFVLLTPVRQAK